MYDNLIVIDCETNGCSHREQRIVQLAWKVGNRERSFVVNDVSAISGRVPHPYSVKFCQTNGIPFIEGMLQFYDELKSATGIVAHDAEFVIGCLLNELNVRTPLNNKEEGHYMTLFSNEIKSKQYVYDTMRATVNLCKLPGKLNNFRYPSLDELYAYTCESNVPLHKHKALSDCIMTIECMDVLLQIGELDWDDLKDTEFFHRHDVNPEKQPPM
jgi:DNA polymerase III epsilon subunit-like protein